MERRNCLPKARDCHTVFSLSGRSGRGLGYLHLHPPDSNRGEATNVAKETTLGSDRLWDCYSVSTIK